MKNTVVFAIDSLNIGGAEKQLLLLVKNLPEEWHPVVLALSSGSLHESFTRIGIEVKVIERNYRFDALGPICGFTKIIRQLNPVLVHSWSWMSTIAVALAVIGTGIPHISGGIRLGGLPRRKRLLLKYSARLGNIAIANSNAGLRAWGIPESKGKVIYNGFDLNHLKIFPDYQQVKSDRFSVTMIASMADRKDWNQFINTARYFTEKYPEAKVIFNGYGNGPQRSELIIKAKDLIEKGIIRFPGQTSDPIKECYKSDVGILLSTFGEGISNSIMEFMACGKPVICSCSGGNPELVVNGITGFLVQPENPPEQIAKKILWLKSNTAKSRTMGLAGKERIKKHFSTEQMVETYLKIYQEALAMHHG